MQDPFSGGRRPAVGSDLTGPSRGKARPLVPPLNAEQAISLYGDRLSAWERQEIRQHYANSEIYFVGKRPAETSQPSDWETPQGDYKLIPGDHLGYRYEIMRKLGAGTFGQVVEAYDHKRGRRVAVKIIKNQREFQKQGNVEVRILQHIMKSDPEHKSKIIRCRGFFHYRSHLCISFDLLGRNLFEHLQERRYRGLPINSIRHIAKQIFIALQHLRKLGIIHCDIKPENVLLKNSNPQSVRLIDFGASCFQDRVAFSYIQSRFYRAPEVILGFDYGPEIDMWSVGAMLCELYTGEPLFPGHNEHHQLACIVEVLGLPPQEMIDMAPRKSKFFDSQRRLRPIPRSQHCTPNCTVSTDKGNHGRELSLASHDARCRFALGPPKSRGLTRATQMGSPPEGETNNQRAAFVNFLSQCLGWLPEHRITPRVALRSDWIKGAAGSGTMVHPATTPEGTTRMDIVQADPHSASADSCKFSDLYLTPPAAEPVADSESFDIEMGLGAPQQQLSGLPGLKLPTSAERQAAKMERGGWNQIQTTIKTSKAAPQVFKQPPQDKLHLHPAPATFAATEALTSRPESQESSQSAPIGL